MITGESYQKRVTKPVLDRFRKTFPRFLATSALMGGGVACSVATAGTSDAVLLGINAAIAAIASIGGNVAATDIYETVAKRINHEDVLANGDLTKAIADAAAAAIRLSADNPRNAAHKKEIINLADNSSALLQNLLRGEIQDSTVQRAQQEINRISKDNIADIFSVETANFATQKSAVSVDAWQDVVLWLAVEKKLSINLHASQNIAEDLHKHFPNVFLEILKTDFAAGGKAYAGLQNRINNRILAGQKEIFAAIAVVSQQIANFEQNVERRFANLPANLVREIEKYLQSYEIIAAPLVKTHYINFSEPNLYFTGRENLLNEIKTALAARQRAALQGHSGLGKTRTSIEYALRSWHAYTHVIFVRAAREELETSVQKVAVELVPSAKNLQKAEDVYREFGEWLAKHQNWLLIFDNVDDLENVKRFVPVNRAGHILYTTHSKQINTISELLEIEEMPPEEGAELLVKRKLKNPNAALADVSPEEQEFAKKLSIDTRGLPLFLNIAGSYIGARGEISIKKFYEQYTNNKARILKTVDVADNYHLGSVFVAFEFAYERISTPKDDSPEEKLKAEAAKALLRVCAYLAPDAIPEEIVFDYFKTHAEELAAVAEDEFLWQDVVDKVREMALIERDSFSSETGAEKYSYDIHRLVQETISHMLDAEQSKEMVEKVLEIVIKQFPNSDYVNKEECKRLLPHAQSILKQAEKFQIETETTALLYNRAGYHLDLFGQYEFAEPLYKEALRIREQVLGKEHPNTATSYNNLAELYRAQGKFEEAEPLYKEALRIHEQVLGKEHPNTATSYNNLASLYHLQGKFEEAESLYKEALRIREQVLGKEHPNTATSYNNLASLYHSQGKFEEAEPLYKEALRIREQVLGKEHPNTASSYNNLAELYRIQGKFEEAEPLYKEALRIREQVLEKEHPDTAQSYNNLAILYQWQGKYNEAEPLYEKALEIVEKVLGKEHPHTKTVRKNLEIFRAEMENRNQ